MNREGIDIMRNYIEVICLRENPETKCNIYKIIIVLVVLNISWAVEELVKLSEIQPEMVESALEQIWKVKPDIYKSVVISAYLDEKISLGKAAELLEITRIELQRDMEERGIPIRALSSRDVIAEVEALKKWK